MDWTTLYSGTWIFNMYIFLVFLSSQRESLARDAASAALRTASLETQSQAVRDKMNTWSNVLKQIIEVCGNPSLLKQSPA